MKQELKISEEILQERTEGNCIQTKGAQSSVTIKLGGTRKRLEGIIFFMLIKYHSEVSYGKLKETDFKFLQKEVSSFFLMKRKNSSHLDETGNLSCLYSHRNSNLTGKQ